MAEWFVNNYLNWQFWISHVCKFQFERGEDVMSEFYGLNCTC
ncbi:hypothetical protein VCRA2116O29_130082 [Vibrio crassostreae]|nr:hypothetical protein VCRA2116O29_130082 [Vibrio crassostreae]CAK2419816.1 hypothetical protein VCRA2119O48_170079 [Vibrio crassostreae]CAK3590574.1 hypothetical protein VCRA2123O74_130025 [Vibrio crassostreae]CAK3802286.1 hypothetical protein VCRA212O16_170079 [Vibrio crassostreae]